MTKKQMKQFKRDRLYTNDRDRISQLADLLKKVRVSDEQYCKNQELPNGSSS